MLFEKTQISTNLDKNYNLVTLGLTKKVIKFDSVARSNLILKYKKSEST